MGFDKPDLGFVLHLGAPSSPVAYYQQVGRAGRATASADVLLLPGPEDRDIWQYFATASMPSEDRASRVLRELADGSVLSTPALEALVNVRRTQLELLLKVLDVDGAVRRVKGGWESTGQPWTYDAERYERIAAARDGRAGAHARVRAHRRVPHGVPAAFARRRHRGALRPLRLVRGRLVPGGRGVDRRRRRPPRAIDRVGVPIEPRAQWPVGVADRLGVRGNIPVGERASEGRALARLTDLGWGNTLRAVFAAGAAGRPGHVGDARRLRARARAVGLGGAAGRRSSRCRRGGVRCSSTRSRAASPRSAGCPTRARCRSSTAARPASPGGSSAFRLAAVWQRFDASGLDAPGRARCCSSTTWWTAAGRSPSPPASCAAPARPRRAAVRAGLRG